MATVRFSDALKDTIRTNAKNMFEANIKKTIADYPSTWADKINLIVIIKFFWSFFLDKVYHFRNYLFDILIRFNI